MCLGTHLKSLFGAFFDHCVFYAEKNMNLSQRPYDILALKFAKTKLYIPYRGSRAKRALCVFHIIDSF